MCVCVYIYIYIYILYLLGILFYILISLYEDKTIINTHWILSILSFLS